MARIHGEKPASTGLEYIFHHVFFPPKRPQEDDRTIESVKLLLQEVLDALTSFQKISQGDLGKLNQCAEMVHQQLVCQSRDGGIDAERVREALSYLADGEGKSTGIIPILVPDSGHNGAGVLALEMMSQNAGLFIDATGSDSVLIELFELSPTAGIVMAKPGRLKRTFPDSAISISRCRMRDDAFQSWLARSITMLDAENLPEAIPQVTKAHSQVPEIRDTAHPKYVTEMLREVLRAIGEDASIDPIVKSTRDDVLWSDNLQPWRRCSTWLLIRVALQRTLKTDNFEDRGHRQYKAFLVFFMSLILEKASDERLPEENRQIMRAKIVRRLGKLDPSDQEHWFQRVSQVVRDTGAQDLAAWQERQGHFDPFQMRSLWSHLTDFSLNDANLSLKRLLPYLDSVKNRDISAHFTEPAQLEPVPRIAQDESGIPSWERVRGHSHAIQIIWLRDVELWVENWLPIWCNQSSSSAMVCAKLERLMGEYLDAAMRLYGHNPEDFSLICLTLMDLWRVLDCRATDTCPMLGDYHPGFPRGILEPLLLPQRSQMRRLHVIEDYLEERMRRARDDFPSIFHHGANSKAFALRYFDQSELHQKLRKDIEHVAEHQRSRKITEWEQKKAQHRSLIKDVESRSCEYQFRWDQWGERIQEHHRYSCTKCRIRSQADAINIEVHEWPLPREEKELKWVVFELAIPEIFFHWRNITYRLLSDIFAMNERSKTQKDLYLLLDYRPLIEHGSSLRGRLELGSSTKPFVVAHYRCQKVSLSTRESICVNHGMRYESYDILKRARTHDLNKKFDIRLRCTMQLPPGPYQNLQDTVENTTHTSNEIIARQSTCDSRLTLHEFEAFGELRAGENLQLYNVARELAGSELNLAQEEVSVLICQSIWQAGSSNSVSVSRQSHLPLEDQAFGEDLLSAVEHSFAKYESNWQGAIAVQTFAAIVQRTLSLSPHDDVRQHAVCLLHRVRSTTLSWLRDLTRIFSDGLDDTDRHNVSQRIMDVASACHSTFGVEREAQVQLLRSDTDVADLCECLMMLNDHKPLAANSSTKQDIATYRSARLAHMLELRLQELILQSPYGLSQAIARLWPGFRSALTWKQVTHANMWVELHTILEDGGEPVVHFNLLEGTLLVDGVPLSRLPRRYVGHATFERLLGARILDVFPSNMPGMSFECRNNLHGHRVHFAMEGPELIIRAQKAEQVYELIPINRLAGDFPIHLIDQYFHWLHLGTWTVEWRLFRQPWESRSEHWKLSLTPLPQLSRRGQSLVDVRSPLANAVTEILSGLEQAKHIVISSEHGSGKIHVRLPRLQLDFSSDSPDVDLECKQYPGMVIGQSQALGTLTGLHSRLVLCSKNESVQKVLIPVGQISSCLTEDHLTTTIDTGVAYRVSYLAYDVDGQLGRLVGNGSMLSQLYLALIHALTGSCFQDQLTGMTGTELSLSLLAEPCLRSFTSLGESEAKILERIAALTPRRVHYPPHLKVMQRVQWSLNLPTLAQHPQFHSRVLQILEHTRVSQIFETETEETRASIPAQNVDLLQRTVIQEAFCRVSGFGAEAHRPEDDKIYEGRGKETGRLNRIEAVYTISRLVDSGSQQLNVDGDLLQMLQGFKKPLYGPWDVNLSDLAFDSGWLTGPRAHVALYWCSLQTSFSQGVITSDKYLRMILLAMMAYSQEVDQRLIETLLAFANVPGLRQMRPPSHPIFDLNLGFMPEEPILTQTVRATSYDFEKSPESKMAKLPGEITMQADQRRRRQYRKSLALRVGEWVEHSMFQWPCAANIRAPDWANNDQYINAHTALQRIGDHFTGWFRNYEFQNYTLNAQQILNTILPGTRPVLGPYQYPTTAMTIRARDCHLTWNGLLRNPAIRINAYRPTALQELVQKTQVGHDVSTITSLAENFKNCENDSLHRRYLAGFQESIKSLQGTESCIYSIEYSEIRAAMRDHAEQSLLQAAHQRNQVKTALLSHLSPAQSLAMDVQMLPRMGITNLLLLMSHGRRSIVPKDWKAALIAFGMTLTTVQQAIRLLAHEEDRNFIVEELSHHYHQNWDPISHPDWLLLELENNLLIRPAQVRTAWEMISPGSGTNSVMQLNMGEGKSSVIVPMVAAELADRKCLVRVMVLKPLARSMRHILTSRLGGLLHRRVYTMPFSRSVRLTAAKVREVGSILETALQSADILLAQPEHDLSFQLYGVDHILRGNDSVGHEAVKLQQWMDAHIRDILDESDEILNPRYELVYTVGLQQGIDLQDARWSLVIYVLDTLAGNALKMRDRGVAGLDVERKGSASFPYLRITNQDAGRLLLGITVDQVCREGLPGLPLQKFPDWGRTMVREYISQPRPSPYASQRIRTITEGDESLEKKIWLLRGLFAGDILMFIFHRHRWRVSYGLAPSRSLLAVPYRAKDQPAVRSEFSHPDVTIGLTSVSYYYDGLTEDELQLCFQTLSRSDNADDEYRRWVTDVPVKARISRQLAGVNLDDRQQWLEDVYPILRRSRRTVAFHLCRHVFPHGMREFPHKLSCSSWDLARAKPTHPTTGFSGTNDGRLLLPLSIVQNDLPQQKHTNALVLTYLLRQENRVHILGPPNLAEDSRSMAILRSICVLRPSVRVLIDVGAQMLEMDNRTVAAKWLTLVAGDQVQAAVFFGADDTPMVLDRHDIVEPLMFSPFTAMLDRCVFYLDDVHTRGTDFRFPRDYRAAVTTCLGLTKDRLIQACMRMRKLGHGQSVVFMVPPDVEESIEECGVKRESGNPCVSGILTWTMQQTLSMVRRLAPLWATQGLRHLRVPFTRSSLIEASIAEQREAIALELLEGDGKSLELRYGVQSVVESCSELDLPASLTTSCAKEIDQIHSVLRQFQPRRVNESMLQEEQERELSPENEQERQIEKPPPTIALPHHVHPAVRQFAQTAHLDLSSGVFSPAFTVFDRTTVARYNLAPLRSADDLLVTADFTQSVEADASDELTWYLKSVKWIARAMVEGQVQHVILSSFEANALLPVFRTRASIELCLYAPRSCVSSRSLEDLSFCVIPRRQIAPPTPLLATKLNLLAGQTCLKDYGAYLWLCRFLGLFYGGENPPSQISLDNFIDQISRGGYDEYMEEICPFVSSPLLLMKEVMTLRRKRQPFENSHLGLISRGCLLNPEQDWVSVLI